MATTCISKITVNFDRWVGLFSIKYAVGKENYICILLDNPLQLRGSVTLPKSFHSCTKYWCLLKQIYNCYLSHTRRTNIYSVPLKGMHTANKPTLLIPGINYTYRENNFSKLHVADCPWCKPGHSWGQGASGAAAPPPRVEGAENWVANWIF